MTDLNKLRSEFEAQHSDKVFKIVKFDEATNAYCLHAHLPLTEINLSALAEINYGWDLWQKAKAQAIPEWISVEEKLPEITDASVLAHFQNGSIETVHIEDWFKDITDGLDEDGRQKYTKWYLKASNTITHWAPLLMPPIEAEN
ncbi:DUF551 domain-containing protein [Acinetobacter baumannii]|uniref:DUF551 domain-containing protein n=1 Tax=Acinetobacter baumannii TaxID=470 RepID=UPI00234180A5|nr:DUF551 domain-containing protein [Acinetobacter baumannii]MDC4093648.1 DUF551 domain-containing protein [Acinetobacter baumannii]